MQSAGGDPLAGRSRVSAITIQKILNDRGLGTRYERWLALEKAHAAHQLEITAEQAAFLEKLNPCFGERHVESGSPRGTGCRPTPSSWAPSRSGQGLSPCSGGHLWFLRLRLPARLKQPEAAVAVLHNDVLPFYRKLQLSVKAILTDNGREFCGSERHAYELYLELNGIQHRRTRVRRPKTNGFVERFNGTVLDEFFRLKMRETFYDSVGGPASRSQCLVKPLQHRTPSSGVSQPGPQTHGNHPLVC